MTFERERIDNDCPDDVRLLFFVISSKKKSKMFSQL